MNICPCIPSWELTKKKLSSSHFLSCHCHSKTHLNFLTVMHYVPGMHFWFLQPFCEILWLFFRRGSSSPRRIDISATSAEDVSITYDNQWMDFIQSILCVDPSQCYCYQFIFRFRNIVKMVRKMSSSTITNRRCLIKNIDIIIMYSHTTIYRKDWKLQGKSRKGGGSFFPRSPSKLDTIT